MGKALALLLCLLLIATLVSCEAVQKGTNEKETGGKSQKGQGGNGKGSTNGQGGNGKGSTNGQGSNGKGNNSGQGSNGKGSNNGEGSNGKGNNDQGSNGQGSNGKRSNGQGNLRPSQCGGECTRRCSRTQYHKPCMFFCAKCCAKCLCVPPGFYGNKDRCACYNNWKTKRGGPKCP